MTNARLTLKGMDRLEGTAEIGGDYVRLLIDSRKDIADFDTSARGEIEVDGKTSDVVLENASRATDGDDRIVLTMRLFKPVG